MKIKPGKSKKIKNKKSQEKPKKVDLNEELTHSINEYNNTFTKFSDLGLQLYYQRVRSIDTIILVEKLINSIANHPKKFDTEFAMINEERQIFIEATEFANRELEKAKKDALAGGAGVAAGAAVAAMAPTAAMWIATTFGTASTGTAISALSGAAAQSAALAWLGGGALSAGGLGVAGGNALLALAGPVGWSIAGVSILTSVVLFANNKMKLSKEKEKEISAVKSNTHQLLKDVVKLEKLYQLTNDQRDQLTNQYLSCIECFNKDYSSLEDDLKIQLGILVNNTKSLSVLLIKTITDEE